MGQNIVLIIIIIALIVAILLNLKVPRRRA